jgi:acyl-CoA oxidase
LKVGAEAVQADIANGRKASEAWNSNMLVMLDASKAHINYYVLSSFVQGISSVSDAPIKSILTKLSHLFALRIIQQVLTLLTT